MEKRRTHAHARTHTHLNVYSQNNDLCHHDKYRTTPIRASKLRHYVSELPSPPIRGVQSSPNPAMEGGGGRRAIKGASRVITCHLRRKGDAVGVGAGSDAGTLSRGEDLLSFSGCEEARKRKGEQGKYEWENRPKGKGDTARKRGRMKSGATPKERDRRRQD